MGLLIVFRYGLEDHSFRELDCKLLDLIRLEPTAWFHNPLPFTDLPESNKHRRLLSAPEVARLRWRSSDPVQS
jgi:hypothetical protein